MLKLVAVFFTLGWLIMSVGTITGLTRLPINRPKRAEPALVLHSDPILITPPAALPARATR